MTSISNAQHKAFLELVRKELTLAGPPDNPLVLESGVEKRLQELDGLYDEYTTYLLKIQSLIRQYESRKKDARIQLRKLLALSKNKTFRGPKIFNSAMSEAS